MIERYYRLDVDMFYRDYKGNLKLLKQLETEKEHAAYSGGVDYSQTRVDGGVPGDPTASKAFQRLSIDKRIARIREYFEMERKIYAMLDEDCRMIADCLKEGKPVSHLESTMFLSESQVYVKVSRFKKEVQSLAMWV